MTEVATNTVIPAVSYLGIEEGDPHLLAWRCKTCGALFLDWRVACPSCTETGLTRHRLADTGVVRAFTIVHRATPEAPTPFVAVVVDLDGGGVVKANLVGIDPVPEQVQTGMRVRMVTRPFGTDGRGVQAIGFAFTPEDCDREDVRGA
jgi:uncharacterized protein